MTIEHGTKALMWVKNTVESLLDAGNTATFRDGQALAGFVPVLGDDWWVTYLRAGYSWDFSTQEVPSKGRVAQAN